MKSAVHVTPSTQTENITKSSPSSIRNEQQYFFPTHLHSFFFFFPDAYFTWGQRRSSLWKRNLCIPNTRRSTDACSGILACTSSVRLCRFALIIGGMKGSSTIITRQTWDADGKTRGGSSWPLGFFPWVLERVPASHLFSSDSFTLTLFQSHEKIFYLNLSMRSGEKTLEGAFISFYPQSQGTVHSPASCTFWSITEVLYTF